MISTPLFDIAFTIPPPSVAFAPGSATSKAAAVKTAKTAGGNRKLVLALFRAGLRLTADEAAEQSGLGLLVARPRITDCRNAGLLVATGETRPNAFSNECDVLRMATRDELESALSRHELAAANGDKRAASLAAWGRAELEAA